MVKALGHEWDDEAGSGKLSSSGDNGSLTVASGGAAVLSEDLREGLYSLTFEIDANDLPEAAALVVGFDGNALKTQGGKFVLAPSTTSVDLPKAYVKRTVDFKVTASDVEIELKGPAGVPPAKDKSPRTNTDYIQLGVSLMNADEKILVVSAFGFEKATTPAQPPRPPQPPAQPRPPKPPRPEEQASYKGSSTSALAWAQDQERLLWDV
jgi:hypothetical protein